MQPRAKKSLGQHFLRDKNISQNIVRLLDILPDDNIIEIGPGPGALTNLLQQSCLQKLILIEKDNHWAKERQKQANPNTQTVIMDALCMPWQNITLDNPWKIISNLPYNVASPLMWDIFERARGLQRAVFMVQKEVGLRLVAKPNTKDYGALSVWTQSFVSPTWGFTVGPKAFSPPPKVDSAVLSFVPVSEGTRPQNPLELSRLIKMCFQSRRKQLGTIFKHHKAENCLLALDRLGIDLQKRPENLSPENFCAISQLISYRGLTL